jgi:hypothetical protein
MIVRKTRGLINGVGNKRILAVPLVFIFMTTLLGSTAAAPSVNDHNVKAAYAFKKSSAHSASGSSTQLSIGGNVTKTPLNSTATLAATQALPAIHPLLATSSDS